MDRRPAQPFNYRAQSFNYPAQSFNYPWPRHREAGLDSSQAKTVLPEGSSRR
jgi:hypothetical protein